MTIHKNTKIIILIMKINIDQIMIIIIIISNSSHNQVIVTTMVIMTIKKYHMTIVMIKIIPNIVKILQKTKSMYVKQDNLQGCSLNQQNFVLKKPMIETRNEEMVKKVHLVQQRYFKSMQVITTNKVVLLLPQVLLLASRLLFLRLRVLWEMSQ